MIIEIYKPGRRQDIYHRFLQKGRMLPPGVEHVNSWVDEPLERCYQIMKSDSIELLNDWINNWHDLIDFEVIPVISSEEAQNQII